MDKTGDVDKKRGRKRHEEKDDAYTKDSSKQSLKEIISLSSLAYRLAGKHLEVLRHPIVYH